MFTLFIIINIINLVLIMFMIFVEHKRLHRLAIWLLVLSLLPILGFIIYLLLGVGVIKKKQKYLMITNTSRINKLNLKTNVCLINNNENKRIITFNAVNSNSLYLSNKNIDIFTNAQLLLYSIKQDFLKAKKSIYLLSYIFCDDKVGNEIKNILIKKAKQNVKVILIYDGFGSKSTHKRFFNELKQNGVEVYEFFPAKLKIFQLSINYRNHRKLIIIDDKISYIGGFNFRDDHMGLNEKLSPWKDTHLKIVGNSTLEILKVFLSDLKLCSPKIKKIDNFNYDIKDYKKNYVQIISSSPIEKGEKIEETFINLIYNSKSEIIIETPYLVLDDRFLLSIKQAILRGVKVKVLIPKLIDKNFVYNATLLNAKKLIEMGAIIYKFNGFLHSKTMLVDKKIFVCGSCNFDMRSFYLNFETSSVVYSKNISEKFYKTILKDIKNSEELDINFYKKLPVFKKLAISFCSLFSPIL